MQKFYKSILLLLLFILLQTSFASNEFYINGAIVKINSKVSTTTPTLYVNGEINNQDGDFNNTTGLIELTGNWTNNPSTNNYTSTGIERFVGTSNHQINGTWSGTASNQNQFYDMDISKSSGVVALNTNVNVNSAGSFAFSSTGGILRTDASSHGNDGSAYTYELFLQNPSTTKFIGYSTGNGATVKYIEGKLRRQINTGNYYFPIGVAPTSLDGMEAFDLNLATIPATTSILGFIKPATTAAASNYIFCDIGTDKILDVTDPFSNCMGGPDGILDMYVLDQHVTHEWVITPAGATTGYSYNVNLHPGSVLDNFTYYTIPNSCSTPYQTKRLRIVAKNGNPGGDGVSGPFSPYPFAHLSGFGVCGIDNNDLDISLSNQNSFSSFRIHGTSNSSNTTLPIELLSIDAKPIDNAYIQVKWVTASEINNAGFEVQRSLDGMTFEKLDFVTGAGNSNTELSYTYDDRNVFGGITYLYRLKQIDFDNKFKYSPIVKAKLIPNSNFTISELYPNPSSGVSFVDIYSSEAINLNTELFNAIGQKMHIQNYDLKVGNNKLAIEIENYSSGNYLLTLKTDKNVYTKKITLK